MCAKSHEVYDKDTCYTAKELRAVGYPIPSKIPDRAWVHKWSLRTLPNCSVERLSDDDNSFVVTMEVEFSEPFRWEKKGE
jgi:hypothetical protein